MPRLRRYNVKGTNDFLVIAGIFFLLCIWAVKDGWFPSEGTLEKHPPTVDASFEVDGTIEKLRVKVGDNVVKDQALAVLRGNVDKGVLKSPAKGTVIKINVNPQDVNASATVEKGDSVLMIKPDDHFYLFNKSLTFVSGILSIVFCVLHLFGR